jgi:hypothetical protein
LKTSKHVRKDIFPCLPFKTTKSSNDFIVSFIHLFCNLSLSEDKNINTLLKDPVVGVCLLETENQQTPKSVQIIFAQPPNVVCFFKSGLSVECIRKSVKDLDS